MHFPTMYNRIPFFVYNTQPVVYIVDEVTPDKSATEDSVAQC